MHAAVVLLAAAGLWNCADPATAPGDRPPTAPRASGAASQEDGGAARFLTPTQRADADLVARVVARALERPNVRALVRNAMRASELTEHKLDLGEFLRSPAGHLLVAVGAPLVGRTPEAVAAAAAALPALDFYMPSTDHRRTWRATSGVGVVVIDGSSYDHVAFFPDGSTTTVDLSGATPLPLLAIGPSEPKGRRAGAQPAGRAGDVIQDADDGELSGRQVLRTPGGDSVAVDLADPDGPRKLAAFLAKHAPPRAGGPAGGAGDGAVTPQLIACDEYNCSGGGGGYVPPPAPADTTFLYHLETKGVCDNMDCDQGNEFRFKAWLKYANGQSYMQSQIDVVGFPSTRSVLLKRPLIFGRLGKSGPGETMQVDISEVDESWFNGDDDYKNHIVTTDRNARSFLPYSVPTEYDAVTYGSCEKSFWYSSPRCAPTLYASYMW